MKGKEREEFRMEEYETPSQNYPSYVNAMWVVLEKYNSPKAIELDIKYPNNAMSQNGYFWEYATESRVDDLVCELENELDNVANLEGLYFGPNCDRKYVFGFWELSR